MPDPVTYKLDRVAGPSAIFSGYLLIFIGLATLYFSYASVVLILLGGALVFSYNATEVHPAKRFYRPHIRLFGFVKIGERRDLPVDGELSIQHYKGIYRTSSLSNRITKSGVENYRIFLVANTKKILIAKFSNLHEAKAEIEKLSPLFQK